MRLSAAAAGKSWIYVELIFLYNELLFFHSPENFSAAVLYRYPDQIRSLMSTHFCSMNN